MSARNPNGLRIAFMHPDLGIGGAERLVVDAALALRRYGHTIHMFTSHHDSAHCFAETTGPSGLPVFIAGNWLPRTVLGKFAIVFAMLRGIWLSLYLLWNWTKHNPLIRFGSPGHVENSKLIGEYDIVITDQLSIYNVLLLFTSSRTIFYCHYPDLLLSKPESNPILNSLKNLYRLPINALEQWTTSLADTILVNSKFTQKTFAQTFPVLNAAGIIPGVLYPSIDMSTYDSNSEFDLKIQEWWKWRYANPTIDLKNKSDCTTASMPIVWSPNGIPDEELTEIKGIYELGTETCLFVSINRFEMKKQVQQAIFGFLAVKKCIDARNVKGGMDGVDGGNIPNTETHLHFHNAKLMIAGGYDPLVQENLDYYTQLVQIAQAAGLKTSNYPDMEGDVVFLRSFSQAQRTALLRRAQAILYTPHNEHFGIVPVEAMYSSRSVIAHASGGPLESVLHGVTGFLCHHYKPNPNPQATTTTPLNPETPTPTIPASSLPTTSAPTSTLTPTPSFGDAMLEVFQGENNLHLVVNQRSHGHAIAHFSIQVFDKSWNDLVTSTARGMNMGPSAIEQAGSEQDNEQKKGKKSQPSAVVQPTLATTHWFRSFALNFGSTPLVRLALLLNMLVTVIFVAVYTWHHRTPAVIKK